MLCCRWFGAGDGWFYSIALSSKIGEELDKFVRVRLEFSGGIFLVLFTS